MQESPDPEQNKLHFYYHSLPSSSDSYAAKTNVKHERKGEGSSTCMEEEGENDFANGSHKNKPPLNKYALASAILASTNSILLGYGK